MALRLIEGFESLGANGATGSPLDTALKAKYGSALITYGTDAFLNDGWGTGLGLQHGGNYSVPQNYIVCQFDNQLTWLVGFAIKIPSSIYATGDELFILKDSADHSIFWLNLSASGILSATGTDTVYGSRVLRPDTWYYIECKVYLHASAGTVDVNINGVSDISESSLDTLYASYTEAQKVVFNLTHSTGMILDDVYIADGTAGVNTFIGPCKVESLRPDGDDTVAWTPSTGVNNYELIDDVGPNTTDYVTGITVNDSDLYTYSDLAVITNNVAGIQINTAAQLDVAGTRTLVDTITANGTVSNGSGVVLADTAYEINSRVLEQDPNTAANWVIADLNDIKAGVIVGD